MGALPRSTSIPGGSTNEAAAGGPHCPLAGQAGMKGQHTPGPAGLSPGEVDSRIRQFNRSEYARLLEMEIVDARPGYARVAMDTGGKRNQHGKAHGGAIFSLADQAFGIAANLDKTEEVALSAQICYLSPAEGRLVAVAKCVGETSQYSLYTVEVLRDDVLVATFVGQGIRKTRKTT